MKTVAASTSEEELPGNRTVQVVRQLTHAILTEEFAPKTLLPPERTLAASLGVSRNVVREATKILQSRGLVSIRQGSGTLVNGLTSHPVREVMGDLLNSAEDALPKLLEVRLVLEVEIARLAAMRRTSADLERMRLLLGEFALHLDDLSVCARIDVAWHGALAEATHNPLFLLMLEPLVDLLRENRLRALQNSTTQIAREHHEAIFAAVEKKQPVKAARLMRLHLETSLQETQEWLHNKALPR